MWLPPSVFFFGFIDSGSALNLVRWLLRTPSAVYDGVNLSHSFQRKFRSICATVHIVQPCFLKSIFYHLAFGNNRYQSSLLAIDVLTRRMSQPLVELIFAGTTIFFVDMIGYATKIPRRTCAFGIIALKTGFTQFNEIVWTCMNIYFLESSAEDSDDFQDIIIWVRGIAVFFNQIGCVNQLFTLTVQTSKDEVLRRNVYIFGSND